MGYPGSMRNARARDGALFDRREVPVDAETRRLRWNGIAVFDLHPRRRDRIELRNVLDPCAVWHRSGERHVQLHQKMWTHAHVEGFGEMRNFEPWRDAADACAVHLGDRASAA